MNKVIEGLNIGIGAAGSGYAGYVGATAAVGALSISGAPAVIALILAVIMATVAGGLTFPIFLYLLKKVVRNFFSLRRIRQRRKALNTFSGGYKQTRKTKRRITRRNKKTKRHKRR